jgi:hypothetical protein
MEPRSPAYESFVTAFEKALGEGNIEEARRLLANAGGALGSQTEGLAKELVGTKDPTLCIAMLALQMHLIDTHRSQIHKARIDLLERQLAESKATPFEFTGVWIEGKAYRRGQFATKGGSLWHCNQATTTQPGDGSGAWTLAVQRGRDARDR